MLEYKIVKKSQFTVMGYTRRFNSATSYSLIPKFWDEHMNSSAVNNICGDYGICFDGDGDDFEYMIADNYLPQKELAEGIVARVIPESYWAVFPCRGALPNALQAVNTKIFTEWLPSCAEYRKSMSLNVEAYYPAADNPQDTYCEIWIPIERI